MLLIIILFINACKTADITFLGVIKKQYSTKENQTAAQSDDDAIILQGSIIRGTVINKGEPVRPVHLSLFGPGSLFHSTITDSLGYFSFDDLDTGLYQIDIESEGWQKYSQLYRLETKSKSQQQIKSVKIELFPYLTIKGKVQAKGSNVPAVNIQVILTKGNQRYSALTNKEGYFEISDLAQGQYIMSLIDERLILLKTIPLSISELTPEEPTIIELP